MWSDWIRGLRDPELLYKNLLVFADYVQGAARTTFEVSCRRVRSLCRVVYWGFIISVGVTVMSFVFWFALHGEDSRATSVYQFLIVAVGLMWACFLTLVAVLLAAVEGIVRQFERLEKLVNDFSDILRRWIRIPAWIAFIALFLAVLMARFPGLRAPGSFLSLILIIGAFGLASFLGICSVSLAWLRRFVYIQFLIAVFLILMPSVFPHETAWLSRKIAVITGPIRKDAGPKQVTNIDPNSPPPFFDAVTGDPFFWYSRRAEEGYTLWDAEGRDPDTNEKLQPVLTKEMREKILAWLRTEARKPKRANLLRVRRADDIVFVNEIGSNIVWFYGSQGAGYELYDAPGFHRTGMRLLPADTDEIRQTILKWFHSTKREVFPAASESPKTSPNPNQRLESKPEPQSVQSPASSKGLTQPSSTESTKPSAKLNPRGLEGKQTPQSVEPPAPSIGNLAQTNPTETKREPWREFSSEARQAIAGDLLQRDTTEFERLFALECLSASQSRRRFQGYSVKSDLVVVTARFRVAAANPGPDGSRWAKTYDVSETMTLDEFQGLTSADTVYRIAGALKGQIHKDKEALAVLQRKNLP
jgi:hypothetical protein